MEGRNKTAWLALAISGGALVGLDRWLKAEALTGTTGRWPAQAGWLEFGIFRNDKFIGWISLPNWLIIAGSIIVLGAVLGLFVWSVAKHRGEFSVSTSLIIAGAASNLADRIAHGWVIDYFGPDWGWPVFNLADVVILVGVIGLVVFSRAFRPGLVDD